MGELGRLIWGHWHLAEGFPRNNSEIAHLSDAAHLGLGLSRSRACKEQLGNQNPQVLFISFPVAIQSPGHGASFLLQQVWLASQSFFLLLALQEEPIMCRYKRIPPLLTTGKQFPSGHQGSSSLTATTTSTALPHGRQCVAQILPHLEK